MALDTLFRLDDDHALFVVGRAPDGSVAGFLHFAVCRCGSALSLSSMPRLRTTPNGFNEWLVCVAIEWAREQGFERVSLNFAPFAALLAPEADLSRGAAARSAARCCGSRATSSSTISCSSTGSSSRSGSAASSSTRSGSTFRASGSRRSRPRRICPSADETASDLGAGRRARARAGVGGRAELELLRPARSGSGAAGAVIAPAAAFPRFALRQPALARWLLRRGSAAGSCTWSR